MPRIEERWRPGTLATLDKTENIWRITPPGSQWFSTATMTASMYVGADRKWKYIVPEDWQSEYVPDSDNSPTFPGACCTEL